MRRLLRDTGTLRWWALAGLLLVACTAGEAGPAPADPSGGQEVGVASPEPAAASTPLPRRTAVPVALQTPDLNDDGSPQFIPWYTDVTIMDGSLTLKDNKFAAEEIYFTINNFGEEPHEAVVVAWDGDPGALPVDPKTNQVTLTPIGGQPAMDGGNTEVFEVEPIAPGKYVIFCNLPGHYRWGEYAAFEVTAPR